MSREFPVVIVSKEELHPFFGKADSKEQTAYVRDDLPKSVKKFVASHELYHLKDETKWWVWRECRANFHAALRHPWGFIVCAMMSLSVTRLRCYCSRLKQGE